MEQDKHAEQDAKTPATFTWGMVLLFVPVALGLLSVTFDFFTATWAQITLVAVIIACVGLGTYLAFWGRRPRRRRGDWLPSETLPQDEAK